MQGVIVAEDGTAMRVVGPRPTFPKKRKDIEVSLRDGKLMFDPRLFVSFEQLDNAPEKAIEEMYT